MCVGICITRRGMVYFGASIHIFVTFILFIGSSVRAFHLTTYEKEDGRKEILGGFIIATYFFVLLMLGCLIFRATEQKNPKLLGWTGGIFITLETFAFVVNLMILSPMGSSHDEYGFRNFGFTMNPVYIVISCIFLLCMMGYCATIIMYISKLKEDGDVSSSDENEDDAEAASSTSNALSRTSSRMASTFFNRSQSQSGLDNNKQPPAFGGGGGGGFNILEVVKEAKRQQQLKEQKELREKQKNQSKDGGNKNKHPPPQANNKPTNKSHSSSSQANKNKSSSRPNTPQTQPQPTKQHGPPEGNKLQMIVDIMKPPQTQAHQGTQSEPQQQMSCLPPPPQPLSQAPRPPSRLICLQPSNTYRVSSSHQQNELPPPILQPKPIISGTAAVVKCQDSQTQTPPQVPFPQLHPHPLVPPNIIFPPYPNPNQSQTLPHRRTQFLQSQNQQQQLQPTQFDNSEHNRPYFLQEYSQRGILSAPSFASITASIVPHRFRNPSSGLRTTKSGTLLNRYDCITPPPPPLANRVQSLQRMTSSSCSSFDPLNPNFDLDQWELQALKQAQQPPQPSGSSSNYHYNALRRGTHRSDYGLGVEV